MKVKKSSEKESKRELEMEELPYETKLVRSQTLSIWISVIISLVFSSLSLFLGIKMYLDGEQEKCLISVSLLRNDYLTYCGTNFSEAKGKHHIFNLMLNATIINISKNPINLTEYKTFGPFIRDYPGLDITEFNSKNLKKSFKEKSTNFIEPIRLEPGENFKFDFQIIVWTKLDLQCPDPNDIMTFLESIYYEKTDFFGNNLDYETDEEDYFISLSPPCPDSTMEFKHHIVFKTAKGNFMTHDIQWYKNSNLAMDIFNWVFDPDGDFKPSFSF